MGNMEHIGSVWDHNKKEIDGTKFYCQLAAVRGTPYRGNDCKATMLLDDFYTIVMKDSGGNKGIRQSDLNRAGNATPTFEFDTECEIDNFINYLKTDFARFSTALYKNSQNLSLGEMSLTPWLDFSKSWDDTKLYAHFCIDEETQAYIREFLPDYYGIRK